MKISVSSPYAVAFALMCFTHTQTLHADKIWNTNDGLWSDALSWNPEGVPVGENVIFSTHTESPNPTIDVSVNGVVTVDKLQVDFGKTVNLNFESGSSLSTISGLWQLNTKRVNANAPAAPTHLNFTGPASGTATVALYGLQAGLGGNAADGSSISFSGAGLSVINATAGHATVIGRASSENLLAVKEQADVTLYGLWIGNSTSANLGHRGNAAVVDDATLTLNGGSGNIGLYIGAVRSGTGGADYDSGMQYNSLTIQNQGKVTLTTGHTGSSAGTLRIGAISNAHSNSLLIQSGGELMVTSSNIIAVGDLSAANRGGNALILKDGTLHTNGTIQINDFNASGQNDGRNQMIVGSGGKLYSSSDITVHGLLQLKEGGEIEGKDLNDNDSSVGIVVEAKGLFEVEGDGLGQNVTTTIKGGTLSVGTQEVAASLTLRSTLSFAESPGVFAFDLFENGVSDTVHLTQDGYLTLNNTVLNLNLGGDSPQFGDEWVLFEGAIANISGSFDISSLPSLSEGLFWNTSDFDTSGGWRLSVIPEPGSVGLVILGLLALICPPVLKRCRQKTVIS